MNIEKTWVDTIQGIPWNNNLLKFQFYQDYPRLPKTTQDKIKIVEEYVRDTLV